MLVELRIENFAIIDKIELELGPGLTVFTGETGAGKSIIIDAVETLLGVRADTTVIRTGVARSSVEATFKIMPKVREQVHAILREEDLLDDQDYVIPGREFRREGRNIARVNGRTVNLSMLRALGELLIDLHGQSEHLSLLRVKSHLNLLDRFAEAEDLLEDYRQTYSKLQKVRGELRQLGQAEKEAARKVEMLTFQVDEIFHAGLSPDEEEKLKNERTRLANAENLTKQAQIALIALDEGELDSASASDRLGIALQDTNTDLLTSHLFQDLGWTVNRSGAGWVEDQNGNGSIEIAVLQVSESPAMWSWATGEAESAFIQAATLIGQRVRRALVVETGATSAPVPPRSRHH